MHLSIKLFTKLLLSYLFINVNLFGTVIIKPDHPNFQYTGRIDFSIPDKPVIYWPGTYIRANFEGSILIIMLDDQSGQSFYNVFIDDDYDNPHVIDCIGGSNIYLISASLKDTVHSLLIFRRTEASTGPTRFLGIQIADGKTLTLPPQRKDHKIIFYGNSITCGYGNEAQDYAGDNNLAQENNFLSYGAIAARLLNADYMCIAKSGIGIMISWFDMVMGDYYYRLNPDDPDSRWDFDEFIPDVVVINLFQNDSWLIGNLNPVPDSSKIINAYVEFVNSVRSRHPNAYIICALGNMDATSIGSPWPGYIESAVDFIRENYYDLNIGTLFFPYDPAWTKHPRVRHHLQMAQILSDHINQKMGWITNLEEKNITNQPYSFILSQNYPNPFNPKTKIEFSVLEPGRYSLKIFNVLGQEIKSLFDDYHEPGSFSTYFEAEGLASGIYLYSLFNMNTNLILTKKMLYLK